MWLVARSVSAIRKKVFFELLEKCRYGSLTIHTPTEPQHTFKGDLSGLTADLTIVDLQCVDMIVTQGDIGLGESYIKGLWTTSNLPTLLAYFAQNSDAIEPILHGNRWAQFFLAFSKRGSKNSLSGSKQNIIRHYDLGNTFYESWLDKSMSYSSGIFKGSNKDLFSAQIEKYKRILKQLPSHTENILEIGCGWGGFCEIAGKENLKVKGITLSPSQVHYTRARMHSQKLDNNINIQLQDYRDVCQTFDGIVSIEMFEAVGREFWAQYFLILKNSLTQSGKAVIQTITIADSLYDTYKENTDFIQKHIFPGGLLPSRIIFTDLAKKFGFNICNTYSFGSSYVLTLTQWLENFDKAKDKIKRLGFNDEFVRKWRFYLSYCIAGFEMKHTDVVQFTLQHERC